MPCPISPAPPRIAIRIVYSDNPQPKRERKAFFFEKKKQKTFISFGFGFSGEAQPRHPKVFCFFFSKKKSLLTSSA
jgi:hypothetical protein